MPPLGGPLLDALERMRCGGVLLDVSGRAVLINPTAMRLLRDGLDPHSNPDWVRTALKRVLGKAGSRFRLENENWVVVSRDHRRPLAIHAVPIQPDALGGIHTALVLVDLEEAPEPNPSVLQKIFGLTAAEADLAIRVARGDTPAEISKQRETTVSTVRSQLASVFRKTKTTRQADLLSLIARVAILP